jgi:hypothetical protein
MEKLTQKQTTAIELFEYWIKNTKTEMDTVCTGVMNVSVHELIAGFGKNLQYYVSCIKNIRKGSVIKYGYADLFGIFHWYNTLDECNSSLKCCNSTSYTLYTKIVRCYCGLDDCSCSDYKIEIR